MYALLNLEEIKNISFNPRYNGLLLYHITSRASVCDITPFNNIDKTIVKWLTEFVT